MAAVPTLARQPSRSSSLDEKPPSGPGASSADVGALPVVNYTSGVDVAVHLAAGHADDEEIPPEVAGKLRWKLDRHLLPLLFAVYTVQFIDKGTLGASYVLGLVKDNGITIDEFNNLGSAFYIGYLIFQLPQNYALQIFPVGKWITFNIFLWAVFLALHCACTSYGGFFALRFLLGATEGCMTAGLMLVTSMFYTQREIGERIGWTFQCNGIGVIISGFISYGVVHQPRPKDPSPWQTLFIIMAGVTLAVSAWFLWQFPDNPTTAKFLTEEEKLIAVKRVQANQNGIETKRWKKSQFIEALLDEKTWLFFLFSSIANLQNGLGTEYARVISLFGFSNIETTILNIPSGVAQIIGITTGCYLLRRFPNGRAAINIAFWVPSIISAFLLIFLPFSNKTGHLVALYLISLGGAPGFIMMLSWVTSATAGHTKKLTTNAIFLVGYALGQCLCTQFWKAKYAPKFVVPWTIALASYASNITVTCILWYRLHAENKRRDALQAAAPAGDPAFDEYGYVVETDETGKQVKRKVEKALLDLTDRQNLAFRYVL